MLIVFIPDVPPCTRFALNFPFLSPQQVHARDVNKFQLAYCNLLKSHMDGLKKQKKKAKKNMQ